MMLQEMTNFKKVYSETSCHRNVSSMCKKQEMFTFASNGNIKLVDRKHSKSMTDLCQRDICDSFFVKRNDTLLDSARSKYQTIRIRTVNFTDENDSNQKNARRRILTLLMVNAWRRQRQNLKLSVEKIENLNNKIDGFEMQVYVLRQLLNTEKKRVEAANENSRQLLQKIEEANKVKNTLIKENKELEEVFHKLVEHCSQIENALKNQENDIITSRLEAENWEKQLEKEREKLKKMESEEIFLKEKVKLNEKVILLKTQQVEQLTQANAELQQKLDVQVPLWDETMAQVDLANAKLAESEIIKGELQKALEEKEKEKTELKAKIAALEKKLQEEDERNGLLGKSVIELKNELTVTQTKFLELSKNQYPWSGGFVKMASLCAKIPVACICTVGSLLLPFSSYRVGSNSFS